MRIIDAAIPLLVSLSTIAEAQNVDFGKVYSVKPQLKSASNTGSSTSSIKTSSVASSIISVLSSQHAATMVSSASAVSSSSSSSSAKSSSGSKSLSVASSKQLSGSSGSALSKSSSMSTYSTKTPSTLSTKASTSSSKLSSSSSRQSSSSIRSSSSTKQSSSSAKQTSTAPGAASSNLCPAINNKDITDSKGKVYTIKCSSDTNIGSFTSKSATISYSECMIACDTTSGCVAFSYVGGDNGQGQGTCWLKNSAGSAIAAGKNFIAGFLKTPSSSSKLVTSTKVSSSSLKSTSTTKVTSVSSKVSTSTSTKKASSSKVKRATATTCSNPNSILYNYIPSPNTPAQFLVDTSMAGLASAQYYPTAGYSTSFTGQLAGVSSPSYLGYQQLSSYDTRACAAYCDARSDCNAFNIYMQRTPSFIPDSNCPDPSAGTSITCALFGSYIDSSMATNIGQYRKDFMVVIQGSNGYNLNPVPAAITSFQGPDALDGVAYSGNIFLSQKYFSTYDVSQCSALCTAYSANSRTTAQNNRVSTYTPCNYFNVFNLTLNGQPQLMGCYLFGTSDAANFGTYRTASDSSGTVYNLTNSYGYALYPQDKGMTNVVWSAAPTGKNATCSSLGKAGDSYTDYNGVKYTLGCGYDVQYAADIGNQTTPDFYSCFAICDSGNYPGCSGFAYLGNTCYFKNLAGVTRTPQANDYNVDMAWLPSSYAGFGASTVAATVSWTTMTTAWTGASTTTITLLNGLLGTILVEVPGSVPAATTTTYVTVATDSGTAATIATQTIAPSNGGMTGTVKIIYPTPATTCNNKGALVGFYSNTQFSGKQGTTSYPAYKPEAFKTVVPYAQTTASYIGEYNGVDQAPVVYGRSLTYNQAKIVTLNHVFYIFAGHGTGYYSINLPQADDITLVWVGPNALSGYTRANAQMLQNYVRGTPTPVTLSFYLTANTYTAARIHFGNGAEVGNFQVNVYAPDGAQILGSIPGANSGVMNPDIVVFPCDSSLGAKFPAFGKET
ncbi:hypothetical protein E4T47_04511 [Aureobasidium subglaciale]|nr:hypothetical protein E4T47_04511 [Aureobasidium subglaciale]